ncbi:prevent-host-death family protein [bacterium]|nr:prevent-host-death family protein [bacterium]
MPRMTMTAARRELPEAVNKLVYGNGEPIVLSRRGKDLAAIVPMRDLKLMKLIRKMEDRVDLAKAKKAEKEKGTISWEKLKKELGL